MIAALEPWLRETLGQISQKSRLAEAIRYALSRWAGLSVFLEDGRVELDSNVVERAIRPLALTRKNALFAGSDGGGRHWAVIASLVETCKLNGVEPHAYLSDVLTQYRRGPSQPPPRRVAALGLRQRARPQSRGLKAPLTIVGWAMANHLRTELVLDALEMAIGQRKPSAVIHHSDQGSQYTALAFGNRCREAGVRPSMGSVGDAYDNAMAECFFATLECELLDRRRFASQAQARMASSPSSRASTIRFGATPHSATARRSATRRRCWRTHRSQADHHSTKVGPTSPHLRRSWRGHPPRPGWRASAGATRRGACPQRQHEESWS